MLHFYSCTYHACCAAGGLPEFDPWRPCTHNMLCTLPHTVLYNRHSELSPGTLNTRVTLAGYDPP
jgi:hypothetical protein